MQRIRDIFHRKNIFYYCEWISRKIGGDNLKEKNLAEKYMCYVN